MTDRPKCNQCAYWTVINPDIGRGGCTCPERLGPDVAVRITYADGECDHWMERRSNEPTKD